MALAPVVMMIHDDDDDDDDYDGDDGWVSVIKRQPKTKRASIQRWSNVLRQVTRRRDGKQKCEWCRYREAGLVRMSKYKARGTEGEPEMTTTSSRDGSRHDGANLDLLAAAGWRSLVPVPIYAPTSIASPALVSMLGTATVGSWPNTSARKPTGTPASGDAVNGGSPARCASSISRSIAARVRVTTGCKHTPPLSIRAAGLERRSAISSSRNSVDVSAGKSTCERSSCRSRCHGSPLYIIRDRRTRCTRERVGSKNSKRGSTLGSKSFRVMQKHSLSRYDNVRRRFEHGHSKAVTLG